MNKEPGDEYEYERLITNPCGSTTIAIDVYCVLVAFGVRCPAIAHAVKKLLCAGQGGIKDTVQDLIEADVAVKRAIEFARIGCSDEVERLRATVDEWQRVGDAIMQCVRGKPGPLSDSDVIGELERLRDKLAEYQGDHSAWEWLDQNPDQFIFRSHHEREGWQVRGPGCLASPCADTRRDAVLAAKLAVEANQ